MYVEVIYFDNGQYGKRIWHEGDADLYMRTIAKMQKNETSCLVCLRNAKHENIRQELLNYKQKKK